MYDKVSLSNIMIRKIIRETDTPDGQKNEATTGRAESGASVQWTSS